MNCRTNFPANLNSVQIRSWKHNVHGNNADLIFNIVNSHAAFKKHHIRIIKKKEKAKEISTSLDSTNSQQTK